jgi:hypothetical protein
MYRKQKAQSSVLRVVHVTMTMTKISAIHTRCSTKGGPPGPDDVEHFARKRAQWSVGPRDNDPKNSKAPDRTATDQCACVWVCHNKSVHISPRFLQTSETQQVIHIGPLDKDHNNKIISDTYALQHQEWAIRARMCGIFRAREHTENGPHRE